MAALEQNINQAGLTQLARREHFTFFGLTLPYLVLVGAMIVAGIQTVWSGQVCPGPAKSRRLTDYTGAAPPVELAKGAELGRFCLGSTAIVLFEPDAVQLDPSLQTHSSVRMGQLLAQST